MKTRGRSTSPVAQRPGSDAAPHLRALPLPLFTVFSAHLRVHLCPLLLPRVGNMPAGDRDVLL
eukprot:2009165-Rhodomonas_salina.2